MICNSTHASYYYGIKIELKLLISFFFFCCEILFPFETLKTINIYEK